ncbi:MAG: hypothetical protein A2156_00465 [Deltaproteobacteria bacterium RBG_16_48_10]|nr:MAG: hypothetical protein A2156_00465 [Deltaproteobacteria bacterium RBG_16_48_10]
MDLISKGQFVILRLIIEKRGIHLKFKKVFILLVPALVLLSSTPFVEGGHKVQFSIVYTNDVMSEVEPCG